ncbi:MAG: IS21 family transposase [Krumholzibacteria bacterium]|nr:IS21 family transposase [Candidatus Krumholzibacteria bacterium]
MTLDVRELIRRLRLQQSQRGIARDMGCAPKTVRKYYKLARAHGLLKGPLADVSALDKLLDCIVPEPEAPVTIFKAEPWRQVIEDLLRKQVEIKVIHQRLVAEHGYAGSHSSVYRFIKHLEPDRDQGVIRVETAPGVEAQVDFGYAGLLVDPQTGRKRKAWVFVMVLSHSRHMFAKLVFDQTIPTWLRCHVEAFAWFGGVPERIVPDNLKAAVVRDCWTDPVAQRSYRDLALHYGLLISPCRPRTPQHKGKVESGVHYVCRNFLAGREFVDITTADRLLQRWLMETAGLRRHGTTGWQPAVRFQDVERDQLQPLPTVPFELGQWRRAKLHRDCHVVVDGAWYSAPCRLIGRQLWLRVSDRDVVIYHDYERIVTHQRAEAGCRRTNLDHYPPGKVAYLQNTPEVCRQRAAKIGPGVAELVETMLGDRPVDRLRGVQSVLRLEQKYGPARLEKACLRALAFGEAKSWTVRKILQGGLEDEPWSDLAAPATAPRPAAFARTAGEIFLAAGGDRHV